ncbi:ferritin-like domain-containing protein [Asticcacaulis sp. 201]|uniref:ferritin-like domain-containing protein n=1 Tax=Asticcacaulis sp. 201 TaxID=3028787 RepID=UPI002915F804|nr:ferritin-like domain-containing protein [Asticcacaulis sp. 201]MDV6332742.1 ferritin-like domain-containing protein [Asticcacaulis sp. 201]
MAAETPIRVRSREELIFLLAEAAEIEHNLMCCYLFAAFSLKSEADGLTPEQARVIAGWRRDIIGIAVEEMSHLALVANITIAIGGSPHFGRPNFPIAAGYHPSGVVVELHPFNKSTLDHFIYLERPEGADRPDGAGFDAVKAEYDRNMDGDRLMPNGQDYATVGHLYRGIRQALEDLSTRLGEDRLFIGDMSLQVGPDLTPLPGLTVVKCLKTALTACDTIVDQGEGANGDNARSHYNRFLAMCDAYHQMEATDAGFTPSRPVATNPVMRKGPASRNVWVDAPEAARVMDLANAIYNIMLRALAQGFADHDPLRKQAFIDVAIDGMYALTPVAEHLTTLKASTTVPDVTAGMSFATLRDVTPLPDGKPALLFIAERLEELSDGARRALTGALADGTASRLATLAEKLRHIRPSAAQEPPVMAEPQPGKAETKGYENGQAPAIERAEGKDVIIEFEAKRCIHARFCVLQQPGVFKANVVGPWIVPDDADCADNLVATAQNCPSGAIQYSRKDGRPQEMPPQVNLIQVRENGPNAFRGNLILDGKPIGYRATLCRCGRSKNKPFCDGQHKEGDDPFHATGEPDTGDVTALDVRDGEVHIAPQKNGPLRLSGNLEVLSGTGRTIRKAQALQLCRCGHSANKPYCDGSHARVGFVSE